jgi:1-acyl-sn-glycerol-3-phosphate acyltransferase
MHGTFGAFLKLCCLMLFLFLFFLSYFIVFAFSKNLARSMCHKAYGCIYRLLGVKVTLKGDSISKVPTFFVANHISYIDIPILGSILRAPFVAKENVKHWPFIGWIARLQRTIFISRNARSLAREIRTMRNRICRGESLILFPEGTSTNGIQVNPFKSGFFSIFQHVPEEMKVMIQPVTIQFKRLNGVRITRYFSKLVGWFGDLEMLPHLWQMLKWGQFDVEITVHKPFSPFNNATRYELSERAWRDVAYPLSL